MKQQYITNCMKYYDVLATSKERTTINKAFQNENGETIKKYAFKYKATMEAIAANTDLRLHRYNELLEDTLKWKNGLDD